MFESQRIASLIQKKHRNTPRGYKIGYRVTRFKCKGCRMSIERNPLDSDQFSSGAELNRTQSDGLAVRFVRLSSIGSEIELAQK